MTKTIEMANILFMLLLFTILGQNSLYSQDLASPTVGGATIEVSEDTTQLMRLTVEQSGSEIAAKAHNRLGSIYLSQGRNADAEREFMNTYSQYLNLPEAADAAEGLGRINFLENRFQNAKLFYREFLKSNPSGIRNEWANYYMLRSMSETKDSQFEEALNSYMSVQHTVLQNKDVVLQNELIRYYEATGKHSSVIRGAKEFLRLYPTSQYAKANHSRIVDAYIMLGQEKEAILYCDSLSSDKQTNPDDAANAELMLGAMYSNSKSYSKARGVFANIAIRHPDATKRIGAAEYSLANVDLQEARETNNEKLFAEATERLESFVKGYPDNHHVPGALLSLAEIKSQRGLFQEAISAYDKIINFDTSVLATDKKKRRSKDYQSFKDMLFSARLSKAMLLRMELRDPRTAISEYDSILSIEPENDEASLQKASCLIDLGQLSQAKIILQSLLDRNSDLKEAARTILNSI